MIKGKNYCLKKSLSEIDKINMITYIANGYFVDDEYTPYYSKISKLIAFFKYCVDGIEFDDDDIIFEEINNDEELYDLYLYGVSDQSELADDLEEVYLNVADIVEFNKKKLIINSSPIIRKLEEILEKESRNKDEELKIAKQFEKVAEAQKKQIERNERVSNLLTEEEEAKLMRKISKGNFSADRIAKIVSEKYFESELHRQKLENNSNDKNNIIDINDTKDKK